MGRWIAALKKRENATGTNRQNPQNLSDEGFVGFVGALPGHIAKILQTDAHCLAIGLTDYADPASAADYDRWVEFEERAAILEYDGGYSREEAEVLARLEVYGR